jgi:hypothetical protein
LAENQHLYNAENYYSGHMLLQKQKGVRVRVRVRVQVSLQENSRKV